MEEGECGVRTTFFRTKYLERRYTHPHAATQEHLNLRLEGDPQRPLTGRRRARDSRQRNSSTPVRYDLLSTTFETFDRNIGDPLDRILGSEGCDASRDIEDITVNRWPKHCYPYEYAYLWSREWTETDKPCVLAESLSGACPLPTPDAGGALTTIAAIDQAHRAVRELREYKETEAEW